MMAEVVDLEDLRWAKWKEFAVRRSKLSGKTVEQEVAESLRLRAWLRSKGYKKLSPPFKCERAANS